MRGYRTAGGTWVRANEGSRNPLTRARYLFVVSRRHPSLYELLVERFQDDKNVEVILDRRAVTRKPAEQHGADDRRSRPQNELNLRSHLIVTRAG